MLCVKGNAFKIVTNAYAKCGIVKQTQKKVAIIEMRLQHVCDLKINCWLFIEMNFLYFYAKIKADIHKSMRSHS